MSSQLSYLGNKNLGFNKEQVVIIPLNDRNMRSQYQLIKSEILRYPSIISAAASYHTPGRGLGFYYVKIEGIEKNLTLPTYIIDYDFIKTMDMEIISGRNFSVDFATDAGESFIVNETAVRQFGWDNPLGKKVNWDGEKQGTVIGVVKDFHFKSLHTEITPLVIHMDQEYFRRISIRISAEEIPATMEFLKKIWHQFNPNFPFEYTFLDEDFARHFEAEQRTTTLILYSSILAILIACLGLLGLSFFTTQRRIKEICIRKILGAGEFKIFVLLLTEFIKWVVIAVLIAWPAAYFLVNRWLQDFAYRITISWLPFIQSALLAFFISLVTVGYQSFRAAMANPADSLKNNE